MVEIYLQEIRDHITEHGARRGVVKGAVNYAASRVAHGIGKAFGIDTLKPTWKELSTDISKNVSDFLNGKEGIVLLCGERSRVVMHYSEPVYETGFYEAGFGITEGNVFPITAKRHNIPGYAPIEALRVASFGENKGSRDFASKYLATLIVITENAELTEIGPIFQQYEAPNIFAFRRYKSV